MALDPLARRSWLLTGLLVIPVGLMQAEAYAGHPKHPAQQVVPVYVQQLPAPTYYSAPAVAQYAAPTYYSAPVPTFYSAPAVTQYSAPAPVTYSAPAVTQYSAPAPVTYSAPGAVVGNAPVAGSRIAAVDRNDIIEDLRKETKEGSAEGSTKVERRKALRELARTKYSEAIGGDATELNESETQEIESIVSSILNSSAPTPGKVAFTGFAPAAAPGYAPSFAPVYAQPYNPYQGVTFVQPVVPVQLYVPVQKKHNFFHK